MDRSAHEPTNSRRVKLLVNILRVSSRMIWYLSVWILTDGPKLPVVNDRNIDRHDYATRSMLKGAHGPLSAARKNIGTSADRSELFC